MVSHKRFIALGLYNLLIALALKMAILVISLWQMQFSENIKNVNMFIRKSLTIFHQNVFAIND